MARHAKLMINKTTNPLSGAVASISSDFLGLLKRYVAGVDSEEVRKK
jgi:hypothetical protein